MQDDLCLQVTGHHGSFAYIRAMFCLTSVCLFVGVM